MLDVKKLFMEMEAKRGKGFDVTLSQHLATDYKDYGGVEKLYADLGIDPSSTTIKLILDRQDESVRWLVPEIIRDAIRMGYINQPIYRDFIVREEAISQPHLTMPQWDLTELANEPKALGVAESMELGSIKYGSKDVRISKSGIGIEIADECIQYTPISLLSIFLSDVGVKLGSSLSKKMIETLISGDQADGSEASATVGVAVKDTLAYKDLIKIFVRGSLRNRRWTRCIGAEDMVNYVLNMDEFRNSNKNAAPELQLNLKTPVPKSLDLYTHSSVPTAKLIMVDPAMALVQLTAQPLRVEADRIVQRQVNGTYVSLTTGFANIMRDGRIILDKGAITAFPDWLAPLF